MSKETQPLNTAATSSFHGYEDVAVAIPPVSIPFHSTAIGIPSERSERVSLPPPYAPPSTYAPSYMPPNAQPLPALSQNNVNQFDSNIPNYATDVVNYKPELITNNNNLRFRDPIFAICFVVHLLILIIVWIFCIAEVTLTNTGVQQGGVGWKAIAVIAVVTLLAIVLSIVALALLRKFPLVMIWVSLFFALICTLFSMIICFVYGMIFPGIVLLFISFFQGLYMYLIRHRVKFTAAVLTVTIDWLNSGNWSCVIVAIIMSAINAFLVTIWAMSLIYSEFKLSNDGASSATCGFVYFLYLISFFWIGQVCSNIAHTTTAGSFGTWYFLYPAVKVERPAFESWKRACTYSLGSIALGSLFLAIIKAARFMIYQIKGNQSLKAIVGCLIGMLERAVQYLNQYAFTYVALYGLTYFEAAKRCWDMFKQRGWDAVINDDLSDGVFNLIALIVAIASMLVGFALSVSFDNLADNSSWYAPVTVISFGVGFFIATIILSVLGSAIKSLFVAFAEDPDRLRTTKVETHTKLVTAWKARFGEDTETLRFNRDDYVQGHPV